VHQSSEFAKWQMSGIWIALNCPASNVGIP
jgi:hypothetical protein